MYCPNCGSNNSAQTKFCRICGTGLAVVSEALAGGSENRSAEKPQLASLIKDYHAGRHKMMFGAGSLVLGVALLSVLLLSGHWGFFWIFLWVFMALFGNGLHQFQKGWRDWSEASSELKAMGYQKPPDAVSQSAHANREVLPESRITGSLPTQPPSITESTTRHLDTKKPQ